MIKLKFLLTIVLAALCSGCLDSPFQGGGSLYLAKKGVIKCVDAESVTFVSSRHTEYEVKGGLLVNSDPAKRPEDIDKMIKIKGAV
jgi:hypothetical protein